MLFWLLPCKETACPHKPPEEGRRVQNQSHSKFLCPFFPCRVAQWAAPSWKSITPITSSCKCLSRNWSLNSLDVSLLSSLPGLHSSLLVLAALDLQPEPLPQWVKAQAHLSPFLAQFLSWLCVKAWLLSQSTFSSHFSKDFDALHTFLLKWQTVQMFLSWWFLVSFSLYFSF